MTRAIASRIAAAKLSGIVAAFLIPVIVLGLFLGARLKDDIALTARALDTVAFNRLAMPVLFNASVGRSKPPDNLVILSQGPAFARSIGIGKDFDDLAGKLANTGTDPSLILDGAMKLVLQSASKTGTSPDPAPERFFLAAIVTDSIPRLLNDYHRAALVTGNAPEPGIAGSKASDMLVALGKLQGSIQRLRLNLENAQRFSARPGDYTRPLTHVSDMTATVDRLISDITRNPADAPLSAELQRQARGLAEYATVRAKKIWQVAISRYDAALANRHDALQRYLALMVALSSAACLLGLGAAVAMFQSTLKKLDEVASSHEQTEKARIEAEEMAGKLTAINAEIAGLNRELANNVKKLHETQDELVRRGRLSQLGQLTATVAHELRNPLGAIRTSAFLLDRKLKAGDTAVDTQLQRINKGILRCDDIIAQLLDFARVQPLHCEVSDLDEWLALLVEEQGQILPEAVAIECYLGLGGEKLSFDPERLGRAVINLLSNASEALVGKGDDPSKFTAEEPRITVETRKTWRGIEIAVSDNGPGIPEALVTKVREPLFTTKSFGTGLGLTAVEKIVEQHGGRLEIGSRPLSGACITIILPLGGVAEFAA